MNRKEYMANPNKLHRAYYGQFVTPSIRRYVANCIGIDQIRASKDRYFNDIPLPRWDRLSGSLQHVLSVPGEIEYPNHPEYAGKRFYSLCNGVCILKEAARQLLEGVE
jgi:hypothetical protein